MQNDQLNEYKLRAGCARCGYAEHASSLHFHHLNHKNKKFQISRQLYRKWEDLREEVDKCIVLCANCHAEWHVRANSGLTIGEFLNEGG